MADFEEIKRYNLDIISNSPIPEDLSHAENTLQWLLKIYPEADIFLKIAAIAHDIERAIPERVKRENFKNYDDFKKAHAKRSAEILKKILLKFNMSDSMINNIYRLVENHEHGGDFYSDILKDADSLSFFDNNIKYLFEREDFEKTFERAIWGYNRLSQRARFYFNNIKHQNKEINKILSLIKGEKDVKA